jgi:hypothetical protein
LDYFLPLIATDAVFRQPLAPEALGRDEIAAMFRRLFTLLPDMVAAPRNWAVAGDVVLLESECSGTMGGRPFDFVVLDRFVVTEGQISSRLSVFDSAAMVRAILTRPRAWRSAIASPKARRPG